MKTRALRALDPAKLGGLREATSKLITHLASISHSAKSYSDIITINRMDVPSWTMANVTAGVSSDKWMVEAFVTNLTDEQVVTGANYVNDRERLALAPPTTAGIRAALNF